METSTLFVIQCIVLVIILLSVYYYFNRKLQYHMMAIESLQHQILEQQRVLEKHDKLFRHLVGPSVYSSVPDTPPIPVVTSNNNTIRNVPSFGASGGSPNCSGGMCFMPQQSQQSPMANNPLMSMGPMVSGILGVLNSMSSHSPSAMMSSIGGQQVQEEESSDMDAEVLDKELSNELKELRDSERKIPPIREGRLDEDTVTEDIQQ